MSAKKMSEDQNHLALLKEYGLNHYNPDDFGMRIGDHKFIVAVMRTHGEAQLKELEDKIGEVLKPWYTEFEKVLKSQENMTLKIGELYDIAKENRGRIENLEFEIGVHNTVLDGHNKILKNMKFQKYAYIVLWITAIISLGTLIALLLHIS